MTVPTLTIDPELTLIGSAARHSARVLVVQATSLWHLYGGPRLDGRLEGFTKVGGLREEVAAQLRQLVAERKATPQKQRPLTAQELRSHRSGEGL